MAKAQEILSYSGDAAGGFAAGAGSSNIGVGNYDYLNKTADQLALASFATNKMIYDQRIKDRDAAFKAIDDDELIPKDILEADRPIIDESKKKIDDIFYKYNGDIMSDPKRYREFVMATQEAKGKIKTAAKRAAFAKGELDALKGLDNEEDQNKARLNLADQLNKGLTADLTPFVPSVDIDTKIVGAAPLYGQTTSRRVGNQNISSTPIDVSATLKQYRDNFLTKKYNGQFKKYVEGFLNQAYQDPRELDELNLKLKAINEKTGAQPGSINYLTPIDPTGRESYDVTAAKISMAHAAPVRESQAYAGAEIDDDLKRQELADNRKRDRDLTSIGWYNALTERQNSLKAAGVSEQTSNGAAEYTKSLVQKLQKLGGTSGVLGPDQLKQLTSDELKFMGNAQFNKDKKFFIEPPEFIKNGKIDYGNVTFLRVDADGNIRAIKSRNGQETQVGQAISPSSIVNNKVAEEIQLASGTEGKAFNQISKLYNNDNSTPIKIAPSDGYTEVVMFNGVKYGRRKDGSIEKLK